MVLGKHWDGDHHHSKNIDFHLNDKTPIGIRQLNKSSVLPSPIVRERSKLVSIKSKFGVEFRRYAVAKEDIKKFEDLYKKLESMHQLNGTGFNIYYFDQHGDKLPINNDENLAKAIQAGSNLENSRYVIVNPTSYPICHHRGYPTIQLQQQQLQQIITQRPYLKLFLEQKGIIDDAFTNTGRKRKENFINMLMTPSSNALPSISNPEDFRQVSSIIDPHILPANRRRVVLKRGSSDKPLGFYIVEGTVQRMNAYGLVERSHGIFISNVLPGGLAESTNLLAENDEVLEVNGIPIGQDKSLDQVRDMMIANLSNLIITTRPAKPLVQQNAVHRYGNRYDHHHRLA